MLKSLIVSAVVLTAAFALTPVQPPASLTDLPADVAAATTVQFWTAADGQVYHTPSLKDCQELDALGMLAPGTPQGLRPKQERGDLDEVDEYSWPYHGGGQYQGWHNTLEPQDSLYALWAQAGGGSAWAPWFGYPVSAEGYVAYVDCYNGYLYVRDVDDGSLVWSYAIQATYYYPCTPVIFEDEGDLYVAVPNYGSTGSIYGVRCFDLTDGTQIWNTTLPTWGEAINMNLCRSVFYDGYIYVPLYNNGSPYTGGGVVRVNALTGDTLTVYKNASKTGSSIGAVTIDPTGTYGYLPLHNFSLTNTWVVKFPLAGGAAVDSSAAQTAKLRGSMAMNPLTGRLFCEGSASTAGVGYIFCYDAANLAGGPLWSTQTDGGHDIQFCTIDDQNVYVCTQSSPGRLYAVKQSDGSAAWGTSTYLTTPLGGIYDGGVATTGELGGTRYVYLTPGYYGSPAGQLWVVNADDGTTVQSAGVTTDQMFTGCARPAGYFISKSGYGTVFCWESPGDLTVKNNDFGIAAITTPASAQLTPGQTIAPSAWVKNFGIVDQSDVPVALNIMDSNGDTLYDELTLLSLAAGDSAEVVFADYTVPDELFWGCVFDFYTALSGDERPGNDHGRLRAMTLSDEVYSYAGGSAPAIDGYLAAGEWDDAYVFDCSNIFGWGGAIQGPGAAYAYMKHDGGHFYLAVELPDGMSRDAGDQIGFYLDENNNGQWEYDNTEGNYWFWINGYNADEVLYRWHSPDTFGQALVAPGSQSASGTLNGHLVFEVSVPFGTLPYQLSVNPAGDTAGLWMFALDGSNWYGWFRPGMSDELWRDPAEYGKLIFLTSQTGDVGVAQINDPRGFKMPGSNVTPQATWRNYGASSMNFTAYMFITDPLGARVYEESQAYTLAAGASAMLTFPVFTVNDLGGWGVKCSTVAGGDVNAANDVLTGTFTVSEAPPWPYGWSETGSHVPLTPSGKAVKRGAWLALGPEGQFYMTKGYKTGDFYKYDPIGDSFTTLPDVQPGAEGKLPEKGCRGISDGTNSIYMTKGNNTTGFWHYDIAAQAWSALSDVPLGATGKKVKGGTDLVYVPMMTDSAGYVYMLKGYKTEFWRYDPGAGVWETRASAPIGTKEKWDKGSWLCYDGENTIYAHKAKYLEFWKYDIPGDSWSGPLEPMPLAGLHSGKIKNKKAKDGGAGAYYAGGQIYALKGGNTTMFYMYDIDTNTWVEKEGIPDIGSTGKKKRVKVGGDFVAYGGEAFFALKGNKCQEMWRYVIPAEPMQPERGGVLAGKVTDLRTGMIIGPNPLVGGFANVRYSLPKAGPASIHVFDVTGRTVLSQALVAARTGAVSLDMRSLSAGIYLVKVETDGFSATQKLVIQH
jgi:hypothetical protein